jgi:hypothetical protein
LDRLRDGLEPNIVEVWIKVPNQFVAGRLGIERFRSPHGCVSAGTALRRCPIRTHHVDAVGLDGMVPADAAPNHRIVLDGVLICGSSR